MAAINYDPATAVSKTAASLIAMTAFDTTNLRATFTVPASGAVTARLKVCAWNSGGNPPTFLLGILEGTTIIVRVSPSGGNVGVIATTLYTTQEMTATIRGLNPGDIKFWDAAYSTENVPGSDAIRYGGPDNAVASDAYGAFTYEVWEA